MNIGVGSLSLLQGIFLTQELNQGLLHCREGNGTPLQEGNGTPLQYSCLASPTEEEPGRLQSMGSLRVGHD